MTWWPGQLWNIFSPIITWAGSSFATHFTSGSRDSVWNSDDQDFWPVAAVYFWFPSRMLWKFFSRTSLVSFSN
jgi:hypothetical protein